MSSGAEQSAMIFGQHVLLFLILVIFFFWGCLRDKVYSSNPRTGEVKENIRRKISNIPAENLQKVNKSEPLPAARGMSTCRGTAFSTPPVICE
jgi:hypothetical protein